jgi:hypothetical protein
VTLHTLEELMKFIVLTDTGAAIVMVLNHG